MILVTMNVRQQVFRCDIIVALTYNFTYIKKWYTLQKKKAKKT